MPKVPTLSSERLQERAATNVRLNPNVSQEAFGGGTSSQQVSSQASALTRTVGKYVAQERRKADDLAIQDADNQLSLLENAIDTDYQSLRGRDAGGAYDLAIKKWNEGLDQISKDLSNEYQKERFSLRANARFANIDKKVNAYMANQFRSHDKVSTNAAIENAQNEAIENYQDPERVELSLFQQEQAMLAYADRNGVPQQDILNKIQQTKSQTHVGVINRMLANGQDNQAKEYFKRIKKDIIGKDVIGVEKSLQSANLRGESQAKTDEIVFKAGTKTEGVALAREIENPELRDEVVRRVKGRFDEIKQIEKHELDQMYLNAAESVKNNPEISPLDVVSPAIFSQLSVDQKKALYKIQKPGSSDTNSWTAFIDLDPRQMAGLSLSDFQVKYWSGMDQEHRDQATELWERARKDVNDTKLKSVLSNKDRIKNSLIESGFYSAEKPTEKEKSRLVQFQNAVDQYFQEFQVSKGREPLPEEFQKIIDDLLIQEVFVQKRFFGKDGSFFGGDVRKLGFELLEDERGNAYVPYRKIPEEAINQVISMARQQGLEVTEKKIEKVYAAAILGDDERVMELLR